MNTVFVAARHGSVNPRHNLNEAGEKQMEELAQSLERILVESPVPLETYLLSSTAPRAIESSRIIITRLGIPAERTGFHECFWEDDIHAGNHSLARKIVDHVFEDNRLIIVVAHAATIAGLVFHACTKMHAPCSVPDCGYGEAYKVTPEGVTIIPVPQQ